jgi:hypothetical protein
MNGVSRTQIWVVAMTVPTALAVVAYLTLSNGDLEHLHTKIALAILFAVWAGVAASSEQQLRGDATIVRVWPVFTSIAFTLWGVCSSIILFCAAAMALKWIIGLNCLFGLGVLGGTFLFRGVGGYIGAADSLINCKEETYASLMEACSMLRLRLARASVEPNMNQRVKLMLDRIATLPRSINISPLTISLIQEAIRPDGTVENNNLEKIELWVQSMKLR